jgi:hypothetical protein
MGLPRTQTTVLRQTVGALWAIKGLLGLLIAAIGIRGATVASALDKEHPAIRSGAGAESNKPRAPLLICGRSGL